MNENKIVGLYIEESISIRYAILVIYKGGLLYKSTKFKLNIDEINDMASYYGRMIEFYIKDRILENCSEEQYILMTKEDIDIASEQIYYLKHFKLSIQRDITINSILNS